MVVPCVLQGASVILSTVVTTLVNRFLDLLIQDYQKWVLADGSRATGSLLGYQPDRCVCLDSVVGHVVYSAFARGRKSVLWACWSCCMPYRALQLGMDSYVAACAF